MRWLSVYLCARVCVCQCVYAIFFYVEWRHQYVFIRMDVMMGRTENTIVMMVNSPFPFATQNLYSVGVMLHASRLFTHAFVSINCVCLPFFVVVVDLCAVIYLTVSMPIIRLCSPNSRFSHFHVSAMHRCGFKCPVTVFFSDDKMQCCYQSQAKHKAKAGWNVIYSHLSFFFRSKFISNWLQALKIDLKLFDDFPSVIFILFFFVSLFCQFWNSGHADPTEKLYVYFNRFIRSKKNVQNAKRMLEK